MTASLMVDAPALSERLAVVRAGIADAVATAGRDPAEVTLIVVTKFQPASLGRELAALGVRDFGENRHQDAQPKAAELADLGATWHFVGQLQSKKARQVRAYCRVIHSVDRESLIDAFTSEAGVNEHPPTEIFLQLNLTDDPSRGGVSDSGLESLVERVLAVPGIALRGVMAVAPLDEEPRSAFARVRAASERVAALAPDATAISMGMSGDYAEAILEGATHLRVGSAITGNRPVAG